MFWPGVDLTSHKSNHIAEGPGVEVRAVEMRSYRGPDAGVDPYPRWRRQQRARRFDLGAPEAAGGACRLSARAAEAV